jgi:SAM-dependent methyltransferase
VTSSDPEELRGELLDAWDGQAAGWGRQADRMRAFAMPVSVRMLELAELQAGERVLELAAGPGDTGFLAAEQIGPAGTLVCSDGSERMLEIARERAGEQGITNVEFVQLQLEWIDLPTASVDAILCRWGVMLCVDPAAALAECRRVLRPGGRAVLAVWDVPEANPWTTVPGRAIADLGHAPHPDPGAPGMFALAAPGLLAEMLLDAGFLEAYVEPVALSRRYSDVADLIGETLDCSMMFGRVWRELDGEQRRRLRALLEERSAPFAQEGGGFAYPGSTLVAVARA